MDDQTTEKSLQENEEKLEMTIKPFYENLVLSGGGVRGISHVGAIKKLINEGLLDLKKLKAIAGTSAGSLLATLIVLGFTIDEIWNFIYNLDMKKLIQPNFVLFLRGYGIESGNIIYNLFEDILATSTGIQKISFEQLYNLTKVQLTVVGSCLTTKEAIYYNHINTPTFSVSLALRISVSMPGFFIPVTIDNKKYIDGGLINNYPMNLFEHELDKTIGILISNDYNTNHDFLENYFMAIINLFMYNYYQKSADNYAKNTIFIKEIPDKLFILNFSMCNNTKIKLLENGMNAASKFIELFFKK